MPGFGHAHLPEWLIAKTSREPSVTSRVVLGSGSASVPRAVARSVPDAPVRDARVMVEVPVNAALVGDNAARGVETPPALGADPAAPSRDRGG